MTKAIQFGAGNIGRGFIGAVLEQAGYHVVFADVNEQVVARINSDRAYTVQIMDTVCEQMRITDISAMDSRSPELAAQIAGAELVTTAVGLTVLPRIAGAIAVGILLVSSLVRLFHTIRGGGGPGHHHKQIPYGK